MDWKEKYLNKIVCADAAEVLPELPDNIADLILTDPPYYKVKGEAWDRQWKNPAAYLEWLGRFIAEWYRLLKPNGSLYCFASPKMAARVEVAIWSYFNPLNRIRWIKREGWYHKTVKDELRSYISNWEEIIFAEHYGVENRNPLGSAIMKARISVGMKGTDIDIALGHTRKKNNQRGTELCRRWEEGSSIPTEEDFIKALLICGETRNYMDLRREYEDLRRPLSVTAQDQYTDVWEFPTVQYYPGKHPCEKPAALIEHIIKASTKPGAVVLDNFSGSGVVAEMSQRLGRDYIAIDSNEEYCKIARKRLEEETTTGGIF